MPSLQVRASVFYQSLYAIACLQKGDKLFFSLQSGRLQKSAISLFPAT